MSAMNLKSKRPLTRRLVLEVLSELPGIRPLVSREGHVGVLFKDAESDLLFTVAVTLDGFFDNVLVFMASLETPLGLSQEAALRLANRWNAERRWPRVWVREGKVWADFHLPLPPEVEPEILQLLFMHLFHGLAQLSGWLAQRNGTDAPAAVA